MSECPMCPLDDIEPVEHDDYCLECQRLTKERKVKAELADALAFAIKQCIGWGATTGSDRHLLQCACRNAVAKLKEIADGEG